MSKYKDGDKFVIEVINAHESVCHANCNETEDVYLIKGLEDAAIFESSLDKLQKYGILTTPDWENYFKEVRNKAMEDTWNLVKELRYMDYEDKVKCFDLKNDGREKWLEIVEKFSPQETIEKLMTFKSEQVEIKVGDVVIVHNIKPIVVTRVSEDEAKVDGIGIGGFIMTYDYMKCKKTGMHIDIQQILNQIGGEEKCN